MKANDLNVTARLYGIILHQLKTTANAVRAMAVKVQL